MADIPRDFPDLLLDAIVSALSAFSLSQTSAVRFTAERDRRRPLDVGDLPHVNAWLETIEPEEQRSATRTHGQFTVRLNVDCVCSIQAGDTDESDQAAESRLHYLRAQVRHALCKLAQADFGFAAGVIGRRTWPRWQTFVTEDGKHEEQITGGRLSFEIEYSWTPEEIDLTPLTSIRVSDDTADMWAAYFDALPGGET